MKTVGYAAAMAVALAGFADADMDHSGHDRNAPMEMAAPKTSGHTNGNIAVGRMKVTIMPEYDSPSVLVIQEGKFADRTAFPREVNFILPRNVTKLTDVCSLSPGGQHFCQIFDIKKGEKHNYLDIKLPYSDFFIDYQYAPFKAKKESQRAFTFAVNTPYDIQTLEVHVQKPYRSEKFSLSPPAMETYEKDGFEYAKYTYRNVKANDPKSVAVSYFKADVQPSVDIKYSVMSSPGVFKGASGEALLAVGVVALGAIWFFRRKTKGAAR